MNDIETGYLLELSFLAEASIDLQFQAWMAISFAVIVASYSGRASLNNVTRFIVAVVYLFAAYALFARWMTEWDRINQIYAVLATRNIIFEPTWYSPQARLITYALGTFVTAFSVFHFGRARSVNPATSEDVVDDA